MAAIVSGGRIYRRFLLDDHRVRMTGGVEQMSSHRNSFDVGLARERCRRYRRRILDISQQVAALHIGSAYSCTEIVDCFYNGLMQRNPDGSSPDTFLMSKGHGCVIQYVILEEHGV